MNTKTLSQLEDKYIGPRGSMKRERYEKEIADLMIGHQIRNGRIKLDLTQEDLAGRIGKKREFISFFLQVGLAIIINKSTSVDKAWRKATASVKLYPRS